MATLKEIKDCFKPGVPKRLADWFARYLKDIIDEEDAYSGEKLDVSESGLLDLLEAGDEAYGTIGDAFIGGLHSYDIPGAYDVLKDELSTQAANTFLDFYFSDKDLVANFDVDENEFDNYWVDFFRSVGYTDEQVQRIKQAQQPGLLPKVTTTSVSGSGSNQKSHRAFKIENGVLIEYRGRGAVVIIPEGVTGIGDRAFWNCEFLKSVIIPDSVTIIGDAAFFSCSSLTNVNIPNSVTNIEDDAFRYCDRLTDVTIPSGVTRIEDDVFHACYSLTSITIPGSVTSIGDSAFYRCSSLTSISFQGTKAQWKALKKAPEWDKDTGNYTIHCTDGDIKKSEVNESLSRRKQLKESFNDVSLEDAKHLFEKFGR